MGLQHIAKGNSVIDGLAILISGFIFFYYYLYYYYYLIIFNSLYYCSAPLIKHFLNSVFAFRQVLKQKKTFKRKGRIIEGQ